MKSAVFQILILCSLSILLTLAFDPRIRKSYFTIAPNSPFSYEFPQTRNGTYAHLFEKSGSGASSRYVLLNVTNISSPDAYPVLENTATACQIASPIFQHLHYHAETDNLVYYCAVNTSLLFIDQTSQTVANVMSLNLNGTWPIAKLSTNGTSVSILVMDILFTANPKNSILLNIDMQSKQVTSQIVFNQNLTTGEAVVAYTVGNKASYIATNLWQNNNLTTKIYTITTIGNTYQIIPVVNFTGSTKTITKLFAMGNYIVVNIDSTLYFLNNLGMMVQLAYIRTKELTPGVFHPAFVRSTDGMSLYFHNATLTVFWYTIVDSSISTRSFGASQDMQIAHANQTSHELMFTWEMHGVAFDILDLQALRYNRTIPANYADLMLTDWSYTSVQIDKTNTTFRAFDLITNYLLTENSIFSTKYYYNKDQHIITFLTASQPSSCQVTHLDLVSTRYWTTLNFASSDICSSYVSYARMTGKTPELVIPLNQSYLIISGTYGQIIFNTSSPTHDTDSVSVNFDDLSLYYYTANQAALQINASLYTFDSQSKSFQLNNTNTLKNRLVKKNGFFTINQNLTVAISDLTLEVINGTNSLYYLPYANNFNLVTSFQDQNGTPYMFFSYFNPDSQYSQVSAPKILNSNGNFVDIPGRRDNTVSGLASGPRSYVLYDLIYSSVSVARYFTSDPLNSKTLISI